MRTVLKFEYQIVIKTILRLYTSSKALRYSLLGNRLAEDRQLLETKHDLLTIELLITDIDCFSSVMLICIYKFLSQKIIFMCT